MRKESNQTTESKDAHSLSKAGKIDKGMLRRIILALFLLVLFGWALVNLKSVLHFLGRITSLLAPFLIGGGIAFLINVVMRPMEHYWKKLWRNTKSTLPLKLTRPVCLVLSTLFTLGILFAVVFMMIPGLRQSIEGFIGNIPMYVEEVGRWWGNIVQFAERYNIVLPEYAVDTEALVEKIASLINDRGSGIITVTWGATTSLLSGVVNVLLAFVFAMYLLAQKEAVCTHLKRLVTTVLPRQKAQRVLYIAKLSNQTFTNFISGQTIEAVIIGVLCFIGMLIFKMPYAGVVSVIVGATALVPVFGAWLGGGFGAFLILLTEPVKALWFIVFIVVLQQLEGNLIYPKVVGKSVGLPGILVLMAVTIGGGAFGVLGMLLCVPVCAVLYSLYCEFLHKKQA